MKFVTNTALFILLAGYLFSCSTQKDAYYKAENLSSNYSQYKTYAFLPTQDTSFTKMFDKKRLESLMSAAAIKELSKKGMTMDTSKPDCFFTYKLVVNRAYEANQQQEVVYNPQVYTPAFDNEARIYTFSSDNRPVTYNGKINIDTLREGTLVIDMVDAQQGKIIWRSTAQAKAKETFQQPSSGKVDEILHAMFKKLPRK